MAVEEETPNLIRAKRLKEEGNYYGNYERPIRMWCTLWTPNEKMEPKNEKIHFRCKKKYLYH
jgi:hypothetical protein